MIVDVYKRQVLFCARNIWHTGLYLGIVTTKTLTYYFATKKSIRPTYVAELNKFSLKKKFLSDSFKDTILCLLTILLRNTERSGTLELSLIHI